MRKTVGGAILMATLIVAACGSTKKSQDSPATEAEEIVDIAFSADTALVFCQRQCDFGPRTMNSEAHDQCALWIAQTFRDYGMEVTEQHAQLRGYDGTMLRSTNIIASYRPEAMERILICAHWDSRPWADNDPDEANWHKPVLAANDGASGVGVMLEIARLLTSHEAPTGIDFICFDAEDWGTPQWAVESEGSDTWALGAQYWAAHPHKAGYKARYGILLDMVGGMGARFYHEGYSRHYARKVVSRVWKAAQTAGYGSLFPQQDGGRITDDHVPVNEVAGIPCIDIIPDYPDCEASSFGPTWHTVNDDMAHLDANTLRAVGQTLVQVLFSEQP